MTTSRVPRLVALTVLGAAALLETAAPAYAHDALVASTPAAGSTVVDMPATFEITMNEPVLDVGEDTGAFALQVLDDQGMYYGDGCITVNEATVSTASALGAAGVYTVRWQVVSSDGHTVSGEYPFTWSPAAASAPSIGASAPPVCGVVAPTPTPSASTVPEETPTPGASRSVDATVVDRSDDTETDDSTFALVLGGGVLAAAGGGGARSSTSSSPVRRRNDAPR